jgi:hypothetical protein
MNKNVAMSITIVVMLTLPLLASFYANSLQLVLGPGIRAPTPSTPLPAVAGVTNIYYYNWAGYAVSGPTGSVSDVKGSWTVPTYTGATCNANEFWSAAFWVGIDGFTSSTVEQTGTAIECYESTVYYLAWYDLYPASAVTISHTVYPGDVMRAEVRYALGIFIISISDTTTGHAWSFITAGTDSGAERNSAEWIAEAPFASIGELPLADFGTVYFTTDTATISGSTGTIGSFPSADVYLITMICYPSGTPDKSTTSTLTSGEDFHVVWDLPGPEG